MKPEICVVGASNIDLISYVPRLPGLGETLHGTSFAMGFGGKGANQAVMAAKLGASVSMVTKLGDDIFGRQTRENFVSFGIDVRYVYSAADAFSGVAPIMVEPEGGNSIVIVTGANDLLTEDEINEASSVITSARVLICQLEIPLAITTAALRIAKAAGVFTIFNPAPAVAALPDDVYRLCDVFCPNESETEILTGLPVKNRNDAEKAGHRLLEKGSKAVILTLGDKGSLLVSHEGNVFVPSKRIAAVDTTGAGDAFVGTLAVRIARGSSLPDAMEYANHVAGISVMKRGTQTSYPDLDDLPRELKNS